MFNIQQRRGNPRGRQTHQNNSFSLSRQNYNSTPTQSSNPVQNIIKRFTSSGNASSLTNKTFGNINKTLHNVQEVAKVVQSATPIVQEYGPIVKNLPAMYRMMKAINKADDTSTDEVSDTRMKKESSKIENHSTEVSASNEVEKTYPGQSKPKLFF